LIEYACLGEGAIALRLGGGKSGQLKGGTRRASGDPKGLVLRKKTWSELTLCESNRDESFSFLKKE